MQLSLDKSTIIESVLSPRALPFNGLSGFDGSFYCALSTASSGRAKQSGVRVNGGRSS